MYSTLDIGTAYTYLEPSGTGLQHAIALPHISHPAVAAGAFSEASAQFQLASLFAHPALGRPHYMSSLPTDVYVTAPVKVAVRQQPLHRAPTIPELKPTQPQGAGKRIFPHHIDTISQFMFTTISSFFGN